MATSTWWICYFCDEEAKNVDYLCESFKRNKQGEDGEGGEKWMGCMTCEISFHVKCLLNRASQSELKQGVQKAEDDVNKRLQALPVNSEGQWEINWDLLELPPYQCKKW